jgi:hypothetical protein
VITVWVPTPGMLSRFDLSWRPEVVLPPPIRQVKLSACFIHTFPFRVEKRRDFRNSGLD